MYAKRSQLVIPREMPRPSNAPWISGVPNEQWVEDRMGAVDFDIARRTSAQLHIPMPIAGTGAFMYKGDMYPVVADMTIPDKAKSRVPPKPIGYRRNGSPIYPIQGGAGFTSLSDLISEATTGAKLQVLSYNKVGVTGVANRCNTLWYETAVPGVGATAAALAAGTNHDRTTAGAMGPQSNAAGGDQLHLIGMEGNASVVSQGLLLYDRIWAGEPAPSTSGNQTVTMTPTRYATTGATGTSKGNLAFIEVRTALGATAHTWTMTYVDDSGNAAEATAAHNGISSAAAKTFDHTGVLGFALNAGDAGISDITIIANSASVTGATCLVLAHPLMYIPGLAIANSGFIRDGINSAFNFQRVYDDACLALIEPLKPATTATTYYGFVTLCSG